MKKLVVSWILVAAMFVVGASFVRAELDPNFTKVYENKKGVVTFNHQEHATVMGECADCHGKLEAFGGSVNKKFAHTVCKDCHKEVLQLSPNAPVRCNGCHVK